MKLRCFNCGYKFKNRNEVFRDKNNYPLCEDCLYEDLDDEWDNDYIDEIIKDVAKDFKGNYKKFKINFYETMDKCDGCSGKQYDPMYYPKDSMTEINGKKYCEMCMDEIDNKRVEAKVNELHA
jgi:hypothetical protein